VKNTFLTAQLFAVFRSNPLQQSRTKWKSRTKWNNSPFYQVQSISPKELCALRKDLIAYWDEHYPSSKYPPPECYKNTKIDTESNRYVQEKHFTHPQLDHVRALVTIFESLFPELEIKSVWFIKKSRGGDGFQRWHQDLVGIGMAAATIVLNIDLLGQEEEENKKQQQLTTEADATNLSASEDPTEVEEQPVDVDQAVNKRVAALSPAADVVKERRTEAMSKGQKGQVESSCQIMAVIEAEGMSVNKMLGDGNCLFWSLSDQIYRDRGAKHNIVKRKVCNYLSRNIERGILY
jgi:hypothetical protein